MAYPEVTYSFYSEIYGGSLKEDGFKAALPHAIAAVKSRIWPNEPSRDLDAYQRAVCAACDIDAAYGYTGGIGNLGSVTTGTVSMSFSSSGNESSYETDMRRTIDRELVGSGLLYMGIG